jgi:hypothetical protein
MALQQQAQQQPGSTGKPPAAEVSQQELEAEATV